FIFENISEFRSDEIDRAVQRDQQPTVDLPERITLVAEPLERMPELDELLLLALLRSAAQQLTEDLFDLIRRERLADDVPRLRQILEPLLERRRRRHLHADDVRLRDRLRIEQTFRRLMKRIEHHRLDLQLRRERVAERIDRRTTQRLLDARHAIVRSDRE